MNLAIDDQHLAYPFEIFSALATFRRKKPFSDERATKLGARTRRQVAADKFVK